jgi:hypothetical protein
MFANLQAGEEEEDDDEGKEEIIESEDSGKGRFAELKLSGKIGDGTVLSATLIFVVQLQETRPRMVARSKPSKQLPLRVVMVMLLR